MRRLRLPLTQPHPLGRYPGCRARTPAFEIVLATTVDTANEDQRPGIVAIAGFVAQHRSVVIVMACGGHEAKRVTRAGLLTEIMSCSVNREDVEQHHLTRSELDVDGLAFVDFTFVDSDPKN